MSDSESDECYDKFADVVFDVSTISAPCKPILQTSHKKNKEPQVTKNYKELLSQYLFDNLENSLKIKKAKDSSNVRIQSQKDDVIIFESSKKSSPIKHKEKEVRKRKMSSSSSDSESEEQMEKFRMAALSGETIMNKPY